MDTCYGCIEVQSRRTEGIHDALQAKVIEVDFEGNRCRQIGRQDSGTSSSGHDQLSFELPACGSWPVGS